MTPPIGAEGEMIGGKEQRREVSMMGWGDRERVRRLEGWTGFFTLVLGG